MAYMLEEGKKLDAYSMVCAYGKTETSTDILHKPSQGEVQLAQYVHVYYILPENYCSHTMHTYLVSVLLQ